MNASEQQLSLILVGNHVVQVPRHELERAEDMPESLLYAGLLTGLTEP